MANDEERLNPRPSDGDTPETGDSQGQAPDERDRMEEVTPPPGSLPPADAAEEDEASEVAAIVEAEDLGGWGGRRRGRGGRRGGSSNWDDRRRKRWATVDPTTGSIPKKLFGMAWPQVTESVLNIGDQMVDLIWAGRLPGGFRAIASLGIAQSFTQFSRTARQGLDTSMQAMISRAVGAGNIRLANHVALQGFTLNGAYSLLMVIIGIFLTDVLLRMIGASEEIQSQTAMYMRIQFLGMATMSFRMNVGMVLQASGDVMTPLKATTIARVIHIVLTPFLMFGWWYFPEWGLPGAAVANVLAHAIGGSFNFYALFKGNSRLHLTLHGYYVDYRLMWRLIKIGTPASIAATERSMAQLILLVFVTPFGDMALAAYALTRRMEMFSNFGAMGLGRATGIMVGQNLGAGRQDRAKQSIFWGLVYVTAMKLVIGTLVFAFPVGLVMLFTDQAEVVELAALWLRIQVIGTIFMGTGMVFQQSFNTAGDTMAPMVVTLITMWFIEVPLAWVLSYTFGIGPLGIAYARLVSMTVRMGLYTGYYYWGRWLRVSMFDDELPEREEVETQST